MSRVIFEDLPSTNTPLNSDNLNNNFGELYNDMYFKSNDVEDISNYITGGLLTSGATKLILTIPVSKSMKNISSIEITRGLGYIRKVTGGYFLQAVDLTNIPDCTVECTKISDCLVRVVIQKSTAFDETNNTPTANELTNLRLKFN